MSQRPAGLIERALELAASGKYRTVSEIERILKADGFDFAELDQLHGSATRAKLKDVMRSARSAG